jgi:hypothetical protein
VPGPRSLSRDGDDLDLSVNGFAMHPDSFDITRIELYANWINRSDQADENFGIVSLGLRHIVFSPVGPPSRLACRIVPVETGQ